MWIISEKAHKEKLWEVNLTSSQCHSSDGRMLVCLLHLFVVLMPSINEKAHKENMCVVNIIISFLCQKNGKICECHG